MMKRVWVISGMLGILLTANAQQGEGLYLKGLAWYRQGLLDSAVHALERSVQIQPEPVKSFALGEVYLQQKKTKQALRVFASSEELRAGKGLLGMARAYALMEDASSAVYYLEQYLGLEHKEPRSKVLLYREFRTIDETEAWRELWKKNHYSRKELDIDELRFLIRKERWEQAKEHVLETGQVAGSDSWELLLLKAELMLHEGKPAEAVSFLSRGISASPGNPELLEARAKAFTRIEKYGEALRDIQAAVRLKPGSFSLLLETARICMMAGRTDEGLQSVEQYLHYFPANHEGLMLAGDLCAGGERNYQALVYYNRALGQSQDDPNAFIKRANVYSTTRSWTFAIRDYSMALDLDPDNPLTWFHKAEAELARGETETACFDLRMAWRLGYRKAASLINEHCLDRDQNP